MPARYVIGPDGGVACAEINPDYTRRSEASDVFPILGLKVAPQALRAQPYAPSRGASILPADTSICTEAKAGP